MNFHSNNRGNSTRVQHDRVSIVSARARSIIHCPSSPRRGLQATIRSAGQESGHGGIFALGATRWLRVALLLAAMLAAAGGQPVLGQTAATKIAILDVERIYREAAASRNLQQQLDEQRGISQGELRSEERALQEADQELNRLRPDLSNQVFTRKSRELAQRFGVLQRRAQRRREILEQLFEQGTGQVQKALIAVVQDIANEQDLDLVLAAGSVVLQNPTLDITDEAIVRLNTRLPSLSLNSP